MPFSALDRGGAVVPDVTVFTRPVPDGTVVAIKGEVDLATVTELCDHLLALPEGNVIVDLSAVRFLAVVGMRALIELQRRRNAAGALVILAAADEPITRVFRAAGCHTAFEMTACVELAATIVHERQDGFA
jgi:anti-anti-sigma factor